MIPVLLWFQGTRHQTTRKDKVWLSQSALVRWSLFQGKDTVLVEPLLVIKNQDLEKEIKVKNIGDPCSYEHYWTSSWNKAWKKFRPVRDLNPWPSRYQCSTLPTELTSQLGPNKPSKWWIISINIRKSYMCAAVEETNMISTLNWKLLYYRIKALITYILKFSIDMFIGNLIVDMVFLVVCLCWCKCRAKIHSSRVWLSDLPSLFSMCNEIFGCLEFWAYSASAVEKKFNKPYSKISQFGQYRCFRISLKTKEFFF